MTRRTPPLSDRILPIVVINHRCDHRTNRGRCRATATHVDLKADVVLCYHHAVIATRRQRKRGAS